MQQMIDSAQYCSAVAGTQDILTNVISQHETLKKEVEKYCSERGVAA